MPSSRLADRIESRTVCARWVAGLREKKTGKKARHNVVEGQMELL